MRSFFAILLVTSAIASPISLRARSGKDDAGISKAFAATIPKSGDWSSLLYDDDDSTDLAKERESFKATIDTARSERFNKIAERVTLHRAMRAAERKEHADQEHARKLSAEVQAAERGEIRKQRLELDSQQGDRRQLHDLSQLRKERQRNEQEEREWLREEMQSARDREAAENQKWKDIFDKLDLGRNKAKSWP